MKTFKYLYFFLGLIAIFMNAYAEEDIKVVDEEVTGIIDFNKKKIWFITKSEKTLFLCMSGSVLKLDQVLDIDGEDACLRPYNIQQGMHWFMAVNKSKPNKYQGVDILDFNKTQELFNAKGFLELSTPYFCLHKDMRLEGPLIFRKRILISKATPDQIDELEMILIPVE